MTGIGQITWFFGEVHVKIRTGLSWGIFFIMEKTNRQRKKQKEKGGKQQQQNGLERILALWLGVSLLFPHSSIQFEKYGNHLHLEMDTGKVHLEKENKKH